MADAVRHGSFARSVPCRAWNSTRRKNPYALACYPAAPGGDADDWCPLPSLSLPRHRATSINCALVWCNRPGKVPGAGNAALQRIPVCGAAIYGSTFFLEYCGFRYSQSLYPTYAGGRTAPHRGLCALQHPWPGTCSEHFRAAMHDSRARSAYNNLSDAPDNVLCLLWPSNTPARRRTACPKKSAPLSRPTARLRVPNIMKRVMPPFASSPILARNAHVPHYV